MDQNQLGKVEMNKPIREAAYETLKNAIIMGTIPAGSRLIETMYAHNMHISRTPLREAFRQLELDGLVEYEVRRGVVVRAFTIEDIEETFSIRNALMVLIIPSILQNVTEKDIDALKTILKDMDVSQEKADSKELAVFNRAFHRKLEHISEKKRILRVIDSQEEYIMRFSHIAIASIVRRSNAHLEHHDLVRLLEEKDESAFHTLMCRHLDESKLVCLNAVHLHSK